MSTLHALSSRQPLVMGGLALAVIAATMILLFAVTPPAVAGILSVLLVLAIVALQGFMTARASPRAARAQPQPAGGNAAPLLRLTLADGEVLVAREVDLGQPGEHRLLLTRRGYMLVNAAGEVIYRL
ncbi:MAG: hypothetical protein RMK84_05540 [Oscillochloridaceae bacterium]|nr:hypothetical protein [Chloroflexaceae bacterium]MDW8389566.1 hypothetical protein [Oscillochloridaceae bacterium]